MKVKCKMNNGFTKTLDLSKLTLAAVCYPENMCLAGVDPSDYFSVPQTRYEYWADNSKGKLRMFSINAYGKRGNVRYTSAACELTEDEIRPELVNCATGIGLRSGGTRLYIPNGEFFDEKEFSDGLEFDDDEEHDSYIYDCILRNLKGE